MPSSGFASKQLKLQPAFDRSAPLLQPVNPSADVSSKIPATAGGAGLAPELANDAAHGVPAGQEHGVDDRGQGLGRRGTTQRRLALGSWAVGAGPHVPNGLLRVEPAEGIAHRDAQPVVRGQALQHHYPFVDPEDLDRSAGRGEVSLSYRWIKAGHA